MLSLYYRDAHKGLKTIEERTQPHASAAEASTLRLAILSNAKKLLEYVPSHEHAALSRKTAHLTHLKKVNDDLQRLDAEQQGIVHSIDARSWSISTNQGLKFITEDIPKKSKEYRSRKTPREMFEKATASKRPSEGQSEIVQPKVKRPSSKTVEIQTEKILLLD